jgi:hypothetical protein
LLLELESEAELCERVQGGKVPLHRLLTHVLKSGRIPSGGVVLVDEEGADSWRRKRVSEVREVHAPED